MKKRIIMYLFIVAIPLIVVGCASKKTQTNTAVTNQAATTNTDKTMPPVTQNPIFVFNVDPSSGKIDGGTDVTLTGTNFIEGATVYFGDQKATEVKVTKDTTITAKSPKNAAGKYSVKVVNPDGKSGVLQNGFTYN